MRGSVQTKFYLRGLLSIVCILLVQPVVSFGAESIIPNSLINEAAVIAETQRSTNVNLGEFWAALQPFSQSVAYRTSPSVGQLTAIEVVEDTWKSWARDVRALAAKMDQLNKSVSEADASLPSVFEPEAIQALKTAISRDVILMLNAVAEKKQEIIGRMAQDIEAMTESSDGFKEAGRSGIDRLLEIAQQLQREIGNASLQGAVIARPVNADVRAASSSLFQTLELLTAPTIQGLEKRSMQLADLGATSAATFLDAWKVAMNSERMNLRPEMPSSQEKVMNPQWRTQHLDALSACRQELDRQVDVIQWVLYKAAIAESLMESSPSSFGGVVASSRFADGLYVKGQRSIAAIKNLCEKQYGEALQQKQGAEDAVKAKEAEHKAFSAEIKKVATVQPANGKQIRVLTETIEQLNILKSKEPSELLSETGEIIKKTTVMWSPENDTYVRLLHNSWIEYAKNSVVEGVEFEESKKAHMAFYVALIDYIKLSDQFEKGEDPDKQEARKKEVDTAWAFVADKFFLFQSAKDECVERLISQLQRLTAQNELYVAGQKELASIKSQQDALGAELVQCRQRLKNTQVRVRSCEKVVSMVQRMGGEWNKATALIARVQFLNGNGWSELDSATKDKLHQELDSMRNFLAIRAEELKLLWVKARS